MLDEEVRRVFRIGLQSVRGEMQSLRGCRLQSVCGQVQSLRGQQLGPGDARDFQRAAVRSLPGRPHEHS